MKKWWGIRHLRYFWLYQKLHKQIDWEYYWHPFSIDITPPEDAKHLEAVWKGEA
jgi:hypothetical protein